MLGSWSAGNSMSTTLPRTCTTVPLVRVVVGAAKSGLLRLRLAGRAGDYLENLGRDRRLANFVVGQGQVRDQVVGVVGGVLHRHHLRRVEAGHRFQQRLVDLRL